MPVYVYEHVGKPAKGCSKRFEIHQDFGSEHLAKCPKCGRKVQRIITTANFTIDHLSHTALKEKGFSKLVRRDKGTYEIEGALRKD
ncbi:MAG TPA: zinc ribbon domain-containing protein [Firmicutes bacterium]|nr:zinc ribbon domain-containing protein [Bacillota bacterium]